MGAIENQALTIQRISLMRWGIWRTQEPLIHIIIWIRNDDFMNEEYDEGEWSRRSLPTKQTKDKYSIDIVLLCIWLYSVDVLCMIDCLH